MKKKYDYDYENIPLLYNIFSRHVQCTFIQSYYQEVILINLFCTSHTCITI